MTQSQSTSSGLRHAPANYTFIIIAFSILVAIAAITTTVLNLRHAQGIKDYSVWYDAGQHMLHGEDLYPTDGGEYKFMYPPSCAVLLAPMTIAGLQVMAGAMAVINSASWVFCVLGSVYLITGRALRAAPIVYVVPVLVSLPYVWSTYILGQPNLMLLACMIGAFICLRHRREWSAGTLIAIAAAIKAFPVAAIVYLIYRRYWKATIAMVAALGLVLVVLPAGFRGFPRAVHDVNTWADGMLFKYKPDSMGQRAGRSYGWKNQSLVPTAHRLLRPVDADMSKNGKMYVNVANLSFRQVSFVILGCACVLGLFYITAMPRQAARTPRSDAIEWAMLLLLTLILSPYSFGYFNTWLLYPVTVVTQLANEGARRSRQRTIMVAALAISFLLFCTSMNVSWLFRIQALGSVLLGQLVLFVALAWAIRYLDEGPTLSASD